tara:strand:+ start:439 stop:960 length:522 start_codon:yes stop_codon:yes gene_type:complete
MISTYAHADKQIKGYSNSKIASGEKNDCVVRAIAAATDCNYDDAHSLVKKEMNRKDRQGTLNADITSAMKKFAKSGFELGGKNFKVGILDRSSTSNFYKLYGEVVRRDKTVKSFIKTYPKGTYLVLVSKHAFTVKDGVLIDNAGEEFRPTRKVSKAYAIKCEDNQAVQLELFS